MMDRARWFFLMMAFFIGAESQCQIFNKTPQNKHIVIFNTTLEPEWTATVGYYGCISTNDAYAVYGGLTVESAPLILNENPLKVSLHTVMERHLNEQWNWQGNLSAFWSHLENRAGTLNSIGTQIGGKVFSPRKHWTIGLEGSGQYIPVTHIRHSEEAKDKYRERYPTGTGDVIGPEDGWFRTSSTRLRLGILAGRNISRNIFIQFSAGTHFTIQKQGAFFAFPYAQVPAYLDVLVRCNITQ